ncbi:HNH endonuclease signature motif containing protein [Corynebacterium sp. H130]|uniref:HNH endonuclease signature motif containing protein n=1 Tax=Corynebacterium sp. H130 TaxID=3133444 RepID=UPI0030A9DB82
MSRIDQLASAEARAMDLLAEAAGLDAPTLVKRGLSHLTARRIATLSSVYFNPANAYSRYRARCRKAAAELTLHDLHAIEGFASKAKTLGGHKAAWELRELLCGLPSLAGIRREGAAHISALEEEHGRKLGPKPGARFSRHGRVSRLSVTLDQHRMAEAQAIATARARKLGGSNYTKEQLAEAVVDLITGVDDATRVETRRVIYAVVPLPELAQIQRGEGDDLVVQMSDGTSMSGREFLEAAFEAEGMAALVDRVEGPVDLYRTSRLASDKQRLLLHAKSTTCMWPGCQKGAEHCQSHHMIPWARGGPTNIANLVPLCKYHNGINDDDPTRPTGRGVILARDGTIGWFNPKTGTFIKLYSPR